jgi:DNA-binding beta-propeller fold protein YncE
MEGQFSYQDFDLLIEPGPAGSYRARVLRSPAGECAPVQFTLPFSDLELENLVLKVSRGRRTRGPGRPENAPLKDFGGRLYGAVFQNELRDALQRSLSLTRTQQVGMRLRLRLADTPELAALPWEFLYDPRHNRFLAQSRRTPLVRYLDLPDPPHPLSVEGPLRLLVMISSPSDYPALDTEQEWGLLTSALARQQAEGRVIVERLAASMSTLRQRLRRDEFHVFHFIGHGRYRPDWGSGVLVMEDRAGRAQEVTGEELGGLLTEYDQARLAVLNACEGARSDASDPFAGVAQSLIQQGLPAVVAMQFEITDDAAIIFAREFYGAIADSYPLEAALAEARGAIRDEGNLTEWGTPVLYSRAPDGHLFNLTRPAREEADRPAREEADRQAREEADRQAREEADRQAREEADRQARDLANHYALACAAADAQEWDQALRVFTMIADIDPDYRDVASRSSESSRRRDIAALQKQLRTTFSAGELQAVAGIAAQLAELDPAAADPDGLATQARQRLQQRTAHPTSTGSAQGAPATPDTGPLPYSRPPLATQIPSVVRTLTGHKGWFLPGVRAVAFSSDGRLLATGGDDKTVRLWDPATGEHLRALTGHTGMLWGVAFSPDGRLLASGDNDKTVRLWDPATGEHLRTLTGHTGTVYGVAFSPDGRLLATSGGDARLWDPATGLHLRTLTDHTGHTGVAFSPDGRLLATSDSDKTARLWDPATGEHLRTLTGHTSNVRGVAFSPDGRLLATAGYDKTVRLWVPATGEHLHALTGHTGHVRGVAFSPDGRLLASGDNHKTVRLWDPATGEHLHALTGHTGNVFGVAFSPDGRLLATGDEGKTVRLWALIPANR